MHFAKTPEFLKRCKQHPLVGLIILSFLSLSVIGNFIVPTQISPLYNWSLYSIPIPAQKLYQFYEVKYNDTHRVNVAATWQEPKKLLLTNPLNMYVTHYILQQPDWAADHFEKVFSAKHPSFRRMFPGFLNYPAAEEYKSFPKWYLKYLSSHAGEHIEHVDIYKTQVYFDSLGYVRKATSSILTSLP